MPSKQTLANIRNSTAWLQARAADTPLQVWHDPVSHAFCVNLDGATVVRGRYQLVATYIAGYVAGYRPDTASRYDRAVRAYSAAWDAYFREPDGDSPRMAALVAACEAADLELEAATAGAWRALKPRVRMIRSLVGPTTVPTPSVVEDPYDPYA